MRRNQRGVALVMVILVLLILTVLGITAVTMMTQEDKISSRQELQKAAFYAAEAGLRQGEVILQNTPYTNTNLDAFLTHVAVADCPATTPAKPVQPPASLPPQWDLLHLGTYLQKSVSDATELSNQEVSEKVTVAGPVFDRVRAYYSLYVRNNPEDVQPGTLTPDPTVNRDTKLRLVAVGFITDHNGVDPVTGTANVLAVKIQEEELNWGGAPTAGGSLQKELNAGGTSSSFWTGGG
jgi:Na+-transporting methylmalonyl-CoA/oxaloacetate decarboxylase gamma subunit